MSAIKKTKEKRTSSKSRKNKCLPMKKGESFKINIDYDLFGINAKNEVGIYVSLSSSTDKFLVYFPSYCEWGEFRLGEFSREIPGVVSDENLEFISRTKTMEYSQSKGE